MNELKILHIISNLELGGAQSIVKDLVLNEKNHFVYSLRKTKNDDLDKVKEKVFYYNTFKSFKFNPLILMDIYKKIKLNDFKVVHLHLVKPLLYAGLIKILIPELKIIYHEHGLIYCSDESGKKSTGYICYMNIFRNKINYVLAISKWIKKVYLQKTKIPLKKIKIIYNPIDTKKFNRKNIKWSIQKERKRLGINKNEFVIGFVGRLIERKGWKNFIEAINILTNENKKFKFLIAGDGPDKTKMLSLIKEYNLEKNIVYLGYQSNMVWFYSLLDVLVIPSHWEPMGLTEIEAQSMHVPTISSNIPALNEIIQDRKNGLLFEAKNNKNLAEKIKELYSNPKLKNKLIKNSLKSIKQYSLDAYVKKINVIYNKEK